MHEVEAIGRDDELPSGHAAEPPRRCLEPAFEPASDVEVARDVWVADSRIICSTVASSE